MTDAILRIENLSVALPPGADRRWAVEDASLDVNRGEILCVVGESGSGKSVLSAAIMGALPRGLRRSAGRVVFQGRDLTTLPEPQLRAIRGRDIAMIFQEPTAALNPALSVGQQVGEVFQIHAPEMPADERRRRVLQLLADTHLPDPAGMAARFPHEISGGQCQRVVIAMALALNPALLIADEPTTALDVTTQAQILRLLRELRGRGHGIVLVTHDFGVVADTADRIAVMQAGRIVEVGVAAQVLDRPGHEYTQRLIAAVPSLVPPSRAGRPAAPAVLQVRGLCKSFGPVRAVHDVSLEVQPGTTLAIVGESGSGKSTLARTVIRLLEPSSGQVSIGGTDYASLQGAALMRQRRLVQMIFQDPYGSLNPRRTVGDVLVRAGVLGGLGRREARQRAAELVGLVGLTPQALDRRPASFSGGQRQRIGIARALAMGPSIVIADESVSALDVSVQAQVLDLLADLQARTGLTLLFITHDLRVAAQIADTIAVMRHGCVVESGPAADVLLRPRHSYTAELVAAAPGRAWQAARHTHQKRLGEWQAAQA